MKITLIEMSGELSMQLAAKLPYQSKRKDTKALALNVWDSGHRSIGRHSNISFLVENISQDMLRQISRHPHINLTGKSTRYCDMSDTGCFIPEWIKNNDELLEMYLSDFDKIMEIYRTWGAIEAAHNQEDTAKLFLPLMSFTDLIVSGNIQALSEFAILRNCERVSEEIRSFSREITKNLSEHGEIIGPIFDNIECKGKEYGFCPEHQSCGKYPKRER